jgi:hypothetical protein
MKWKVPGKIGGLFSLRDDTYPEEVIPDTDVRDRRSMQIIDFTDACDIRSGTEIERFVLLCYYKAKEDGQQNFSMRKMMEIYREAGLTPPDRNALDKDVKASGQFRPHGIEGTLRFASGVFDGYEKEYGHLWNSAAGIPAGSEVLDEDRFCGRRESLDRLVTQINSSYRDGSYDACASVMRRLFEVSMILAFQSKGMEDAIRGSDGYLCLGDIVKRTIETDALGLSGRKDDLSDISMIGDYSGRGPMYTFSANSINSVRVAYRELLDILYNISGFP